MLGQVIRGRKGLWGDWGDWWGVGHELAVQSGGRQGTWPVASRRRGSGGRMGEARRGQRRRAEAARSRGRGRTGGAGEVEDKVEHTSAKDADGAKSYQIAPWISDHANLIRCGRAPVI